jgi:2-keto-4-pentenoate hydratase/2-oxohepta-3-ene-1,7-dioic acid hydratase in catechol pathway
VKLVCYSPAADAADDEPPATRIGLLADDGIHDLTEGLPQPKAASHLGDLLQLEPERIDEVLGKAHHGRAMDPAAVRLRAPLMPGKTIAVGLNYGSHCREQGRPLPDYPILFAILPNAIVGPGEPVVDNGG